MRRILILLFVLASVPGYSIIRFGIQGGISSANVAAEPTFTSSARGGFALGAALELGLGGSLNLQPEAFYVQKGYVVPASGAVAETTVKTDYFEIPLFLKYSIDLFLLKPFLMAGPYLGFKSKAESTSGGVSTDLTLVKSTDLGLAFGGGVEFSFSPVTSLFAAARYDLGMTNITDQTGQSVKNKGLLIMGGFLFGV